MTRTTGSINTLIRSESRVFTLDPAAPEWIEMVKQAGLGWGYGEVPLPADGGVGIQVRGEAQTVSMTKVNKYANDMENGDWFAPVVLTADGVVVIGHHRVAAARRNGYLTIRAIVLTARYANAEPAVLDQLHNLAMKSNNRHGEPMKRADQEAHLERYWRHDSTAAQFSRDTGINVGLINGFLGRRHTAERAAKLNIAGTLDELTPGMRAVLGSQYIMAFNDDVWTELLALARNGKLSETEVRTIARRLRPLPTDGEKIELLTAENVRRDSDIRALAAGGSRVRGVAGKTAEIQRTLAFFKDEVGPARERKPGMFVPRNLGYLDEHLREIDDSMAVLRGLRSDVMAALENNRG